VTSTGSAPRHRPLVSVVIPVYNHEAYVARAIESVLAQTYRNLQVIAIDDGSTDGSMAVLRSFDDPRLEVLHQRNRGAHHTLNRGIRLARGQYISVLNSDDVYDRGRLARFVAICERKPKVAACFSHIDIIDGKGRVVGHIDGPSHNPSWRPPGRSSGDRHDPLIDLLGGNYLATTSNLFCRRSIVTALGPFRSFRYAHDFDFFARLCSKHEIEMVERPLLLYRTHATNTIKENQAATHFEHALVLSGILSNGLMNRVLEPGADPYDALARLFRRLDGFGADKVILALMLAQLKAGRSYGALCRQLIDDPGNPLRRQCIAFLQHRRGADIEERIAGALRELEQTPRPDRQVYLFGTGKFSELVRKHLDTRRLRPVGYFDNSQAMVGRRIAGLEVESPRFVPGVAVIVASSARRPITRQLASLGYRRADILTLSA
jgi:glycosyltransferase involved in cell wall biosynthesis